MRFKEMCRTCMCVGHELYPFFPQEDSGNDFSLVKGLPHVAEMVMAISSVRLKLNDGLPGQVCMQCIKTVELILHFRDLSEKSESLYRKYISERNILTLTPPEDNTPVKQEPCVESLDASDDYTDDFLIYKTEMELPVEGPKEEKTPLTDVKRKSKVRSCDSCDKTYLTRKALRRHALIHKASRFSCMKHCKSVFSRRDHLKKHLQTVHAMEDVDTFMNVLAAKTKVKYDCQHCGVDAPSKVAMAKHLRACHRDKLPPRKNGSCELQSSDKDFEDDDNCSNNQAEDSEEVTKVDTRRTVGEVSASGGGAIATIKEERGEDGDPGGLVLEVRYECSQCGAAYDSQHSYAAHMTKHSQPVPKGQTTFRCNVCDKVFHKRKNLKQHSLTHNKEKANKCTLCCRAFTRPDQLILHMNNHTGKKRHQCTHCEKGFNMLSTLKDHLRTHSGERPFLCSICGKGFTQNTNLKQHLMRHSATKPYTCPTCLNKFVSKGELDAHLRKHTGEHPFVCSTCGTGFTTSSSLVKHKRIHSGERPYVCDLCPQRFTALGTLKNHRRTHTGEKPFACTHCIRAFAQKSDLVSHIRTHTGERPYVCSTCGSPYQQSSALKAHIKAHHSTNAKVPLNVVMESQLTDIQSAYRSAIDSSQSPHFPNP